MYKILKTCPEYELVSCIHNGHWTNSVAEIFADTDNGATVATHLHFYVTRSEARKLWHGIKDFVPATIETVSFKR